jgi:transcriptional regulator with PAS, ATPase and Fis domain
MSNTQPFGLSIITRSEKHKENVINQLTNLLGPEISIKGYSILEGIKEKIYDRLVLISHEYLKETAYRYIDPRAEVLVARRALNHSKLEDVLCIPHDEDVLFVDVNKYLAENSISLLEGLGINHIRMYPYYPGQKFSQQADYAITTGETHMVPDCIRNVIDLGYSKIDLTTITEIMLKLSILDERTNLLSARFLQDFVYSGKKVVKALETTDNMKKQLNTILNVINDGIVGIDNNGRIMFSNENAKKLFNSRVKDNKDKNMEINLDDILDFDAKALLGGNFGLYRKIHEIMGKKILLTMMPIIRNGENNGVIITFKDLSEIIEMENIVRANLMKRGHTSKYEFSNIAGKSRIISETKEIACKLAKSNSTLLLIGESGSGKELFAHAIHKASCKQHGPFVAVNFAALPENLLESELFGYEEGAFTGARKGGHAGLFEQAHKGTIFLDEIGDASMRIQTRLLRVLQEKEVLRIGGTKIIPIDVRIIAATNKNLEELVRAQKFREDLFYRLKVLPIRIPPLRERKEDIPLLIKKMLEKFPPEKEMIISDRAMEKFMEYDWPGNIRELENVVEYLFHIVGDGEVRSKDLPFTSNDKSLQQEKILKAIEEEMPMEELMLILDTLKREKDAGNAYLNRKKLAELCSREIRMTEQMVRNRLNILSQYGLVITRKGPKGTRLSLNGEDCIGIIKKRMDTDKFAFGNKGFE